MTHSHIQTGPGISRTPLPKGFTTSGINSGVRKYRPDLGLILSEHPATTVGVYTLNEMKAAPIRYCQSILPSSQIRAIVTNSGQANAATGTLGDENNLKMAASAAQYLGCETHQVLTASTGVIGQHLAFEKINAAMPELIQRCVDNAEAFALAILTTDLVPKTATTEVALSTGTVRITGLCKGSGMIHPNMGTMLGYVLTDAILSEERAQKLIHQTVDLSFNMISVDGDSSTNDCVFLMANGSSQCGIETADDEYKFQTAMTHIMQTLAKSIARDGEGATKLIEVTLTGAPSQELARKAARGVTLSPLIKTAIHGEDPNWGRIVARLGAERVPASVLAKMDLSIQGTPVFMAGSVVEFDRAALRQSLKRDTVYIKAELHSGTEEATAWGCDLSKKYVEINTEYS
jgi:glutamate N-acetyltransferase/amino-acid N-acetyltransferase